jgi:hypothetical protein
MPPDSPSSSQTFSMNFAAHVAAARLAALGQLALDHHLRGDAGMVDARLPQARVLPCC